MQIRQLQFSAIGTAWDIQLSQAIAIGAWNELIGAIRQRIADFDATYSRFRPDSTVSHMAAAAGRYTVPADAYDLLSLYERLYAATDGKVTPLIGQVMADAGYDATYSLQPKPLQAPVDWNAVISYGHGWIELAQPALLDFGAAGKGYLVDIVSALIEAAGIQNYVVNAGGDIRRKTTTNQLLPVGLENPQDTTEAIGIVNLATGSLCASAGSKRAWGKFHHIIDPVELRSPRQVLATWVLAADTATADGLATALFFNQPAILQRQFEFAWAVLYADMQLQHSPDFPVTIFEAQTS